MSIVRTTAYTIDLDKPTLEDRWTSPLTCGDRGANVIQATLTRGAAPATLSGLTAMLYGVLSNGATAFKSCTVAGNVVTCELDHTFYAVPGRLELLLRLSEGTTVINTPLRISAYIKSGPTDELVSTGEEFSLAELQAVVAACEEATAIALAAEGPKGETGAQVVIAEFVGDDIVFVLDDDSEVVLEDAKTTLTGPQGIQGPAGVMTYSGTAITGTSTTPTAYATGITMAYVGDRYYYNGAVDAARGNVYKCTLGGDADTALWVYDGNIRGTSGSGSVSTVNEKSPDAYGDVTLSADEILTGEGDETVEEKLDSLDDGLSGKASVHRFTVVLEAAEWSGSAPYTQTVSVAGMLDTDVPKMDVVLSSTLATRIAQREAYACISMIESGAGELTVTCDEEKPTVDLTVQLEVIR